MISTLTPQPDAMREGLSLPMLATDLCEHLVRRGIPFRHGHMIAGQVRWVQYGVRYGSI